VLGYGAVCSCWLSLCNAWLVVTAVALLALVLALRSKELAHALPRTSLSARPDLHFRCWRCAVVLRGFGRTG